MKYFPLFCCCALVMITINDLPARELATFVVDPSIADGSASSADSNVYGSIQQAVEAALRQPSKGGTVIELRQALYLLKEPVRLGAEDLAKLGGRLVFRAAKGQSPVISGGMELGGWVLHDQEKGIWKSKAGQPVQSRSLIVNGARAVRARSLGGLTEPVVTETGYTAKDVALADWKNIDKAEFVYRAIWTNPRCGIAGVESDGKTLTIQMKQPGWKFGRDKGITSIGTPWYIENAYELLDQPGEWYLDETGAIDGTAFTVYYKPQSWENMETAKVVLPLLENLFVFEGTSENPVKGVSFEGIGFENTAWLRPGSDRGHPDAQNNVIRENLKEGREFVGEGAALRFVTAQNIQMLDCSFRNLGGMGILMTLGARDVKIIGNSFVNIAAGAIQIGDYLDWPQKESPNNPSVDVPALQVANITIQNNFIWRVGVEYRSATAIALTFPINCDISHNEIYHTPYIGMHLGWSWIRIDSSNTADNVIANNRIENVMVELADGAGIYTLGASKSADHPTILRDNFVRRSRWGHAYYFDEGSSFIRVEGGAAVETSDFNVKVNGPTSNNITVRGLLSDKDRNTVPEQAKEIHIEPAILITEENKGLLEAMKAASGLEKEFEGIRHVIVDPFVIEAEEAVLTGSARAGSGMGDGRMGYSGMGFVEGLGASKGAEILFNFEMTKDCEREFVIRYHLSGDNQSPIHLQVNDKKPVEFLAEFTGARDSWDTWTTKVSLKKGSNTISLINEGEGKPNLIVDRIELLPIKTP